MILGLMLLEVLSVGLFAVVLINQQQREGREHALQRLAHQATSLALQSEEAFKQQRPDWVTSSLKMMGDAPSVDRAKITDVAGNLLYVSEGIATNLQLDPAERAQIAQLKGDAPKVFLSSNGQWEGVKSIDVGGELRGYAWVETNRSWDSEQLTTMLRSTTSFAIIWIGVSALLVLLMSRAISQPLGILQGGTRALMQGPEGSADFPLPVTVENEFGDLIEAFNRMVASIDEQRSGLNDTLSLLDSMLANAPIGLVFFDRQCRIVRVNNVFADMTGVPLTRHLGRSLPELLPTPVAMQLEQAVLRVIETGSPVRDLELTGPAEKLKWPWTWLVTAYPVRTTPNQVRWVGVILLDASERKRSEEALRRTEKLAATGRLAASIAHEINNPLEAITNLLFLLRKFSKLDAQALNYVTMAQEEVRRMSEITQQTLRFYRQSTLPARSNMAELLDSVLNLYSVRLSTLGIRLDRDYDAEMDLYCFAGEVRQVIANLVSNAMDATNSGGHLIVRARRSRDWSDSGKDGVRFTVADTGCGMEDGVRQRLFEAFFTTKGITGTGLGLWVSHEIVAKHNGTVRVRSRVASNGGPSGTVFQMFLPDNQELTTAVSQQVTAEA
jgi:PAS domain S-box-containing protein